MRIAPAAALPLVLASVTCGQITGSHVNYLQTLNESSVYLHEYCLPPCACPSSNASGPLTGSFTLVYDHSDQWTSFYTVHNVDLHASTNRESDVHFTGAGTYEIGGDFALTQRLTLALNAGNFPDQTLAFDSGTLVVHNYIFPALELSAATEQLGCSRLTLTFSTTATPLCRADIGSAGGQAGPDHALDNNDFIVFINLFFNTDPQADFGAAGGLPGPDGQFDNNDFIAFINAFFDGASGC
jgi:hypothetical protein